jgi:hypothetical protein
MRCQTGRLRRNMQVSALEEEEEEEEEEDVTEEEEEEEEEKHKIASR